jgi:hypothetical protein
MLGIVFYGKRLCAESLKERYLSEDLIRRISWRCAPGDGVAWAKEVVVPVRAVVFGCALRGVLASVPLLPVEIITITKMPAADLSYGWTGYYSTIRAEQKKQATLSPAPE